MVGTWGGFGVANGALGEAIQVVRLLGDQRLLAWLVVRGLDFQDKSDREPRRGHHLTVALGFLM